MLDRADIEPVVRAALAEDFAYGPDVTSVCSRRTRRSKR